MLTSSLEKIDIRTVPLNEIFTPTFLNFRTTFDESAAFGDLVKSIRRHGLLQPLVIRRTSRNLENGTQTRFDLICGKRRFEACKKNGLRAVQCVVMDLSDREAFEISLVENLQRRSLNPVEEAEAFKSYILSFGRGGMSRLAERIGKSEEYVSHRLLLLGLPKVILDRISRRQLNVASATELIWIKNEKRQIELSENISRLGLSQRQVRAAVRLLKHKDTGVNEAVESVVGKNSNAPQEKLFANEVDAPWQEYDEAGDSDKRMDALNRAELVMRTAVAGLDLLLDRYENDLILKNTLLKERQIVHSVLDDLVRSKVAIRRNGTLSPLQNSPSSR